MRYTTYLSLLFLLSLGNLHAQSVLSGLVTDSLNVPISKNGCIKDQLRVSFVVRLESVWNHFLNESGGELEVKLLTDSPIQPFNFAG